MRLCKKTCAAIVAMVGCTCASLIWDFNLSFPYVKDAGSGGVGGAVSGAVSVTANDQATSATAATAAVLRMELQTQPTSGRLPAESAAICCIFKDEEKYIDEWVDYHLALGFSHIYFYDNSDHFEMKEWWEERRNKDSTITLVHFPGRGLQTKAYHDCANRFGNSHAWMAFFDIDEFLWLKQHSTVVDFLHQHCPHGAVAINWVMMHSNPVRLVYEPLPVTQRFLYSEGVVHNHVKSIVRLEDMDKNRYPHAHFPYLLPDKRSVTTNGVIVEGYAHSNGPMEVAVFLHYWTKSRKEFIDKRRRGDVELKEGEADKLAEMVAQAKSGAGVINGTKQEAFYKEAFLKYCPKYAKGFENDKDLATTTMMTPAMANNNNAALCIIAKNEEAYMDEWVNYHHALGFSHFYIYDAADPLGLVQWGQEKGSHVTVIPFEAEQWTVELKSQAYMDCVKKNAQKSNHAWLAFFDVNEFLMLREHASIDSFLFRQQEHWTRRWSLRNKKGNTDSSPKRKNRRCGIQKILTHRFGTSDHSVYRPLPVTQRFLYRDDPDSTTTMSAVEGPVRFILHLEDLHLLDSNNANYSQVVSLFQKIASSSSPIENLDDDRGWGLLGEGCDLPVSVARNVAVLHHYIKSRKECQLRRLDFVETTTASTMGANRRNASTTDSCNIIGTKRDTTGWETVKKYTPKIAGFDDFVKH